MKYHINDVKDLPKYTSGLYFMFNEHILIYIGKTIDFNSRIYENRLIKDFLPFGYIATHVVIIEISKEENDLKKLEDKLIKFFNPPCNLPYGCRPKS